MASSSVREGWWLGMANEALELVEAEAATPAGQAKVDAGYWAQIARAVGQIRGWDHPSIPGYYDKLWALQHSGGGFGQGVPLDSFNDGSVNPANTTYGITTGDFVGMHLLEGFDHGVVTQAQINSVADCVLAWVQTTNTRTAAEGGNMLLPDYDVREDGTSNPNDHGRAAIWNIVACLSAFLLNVRFKVNGTRAGQTIDRTTEALNTGSRWKNAGQWALNKPVNMGGWTYQYQNGSARQDSGHNAVCAELWTPWLGTGPALSQVAYGPLAPETLQSYIGGFLRLAYIPGNENYLDKYVGYVAQAMAPAAHLAINCFRIHNAYYIP